MPIEFYPGRKIIIQLLNWSTLTETFSDYLTNNKLMAYTDTNTFTYIISSAKLDTTGQRWASALGQYDFDIVYRAGLNNVDVDTMSRYIHLSKLQKEIVWRFMRRLLKPFVASFK